ncbi:hypothetical protein BKA81DRAFT_350268, partial [Phyllosticta paracitricarpa]
MLLMWYGVILWMHPKRPHVDAPCARTSYKRSGKSNFFVSKFSMQRPEKRDVCAFLTVLLLWTTRPFSLLAPCLGLCNTRWLPRHSVTLRWGPAVLSGGVASCGGMMLSIRGL